MESVTSSVLALYRAAMEPQPPTALDITTLVVAICAAVVAATALGWQIASWLLSGGRAKVELLNGALHQFGPQWIVMPPNKPLDPSGAANGFTRRAIFVEVRNVGRLPITVTSWQLKLPGGVKIGELNSPNGPRLPHRLDVGDSEKWAIEVDSELVAALRATRKMAKVDDVEVRAVVSLGSGKEIKTPQRITFTAKELEQGA
ncbi:hypothetical protein SAMN05421803_107168 [Nocardiopsis flavescens]|uniref:Uncharacterized protein n=1 Tax=Nocardiopsis flavescens TaxID=758803 RepID=A0A1M6KGN9_9ACTN|nr:hypothetical protein SAMN05421803_107168 [Nocardiopsis flavescens]